MAPRLLRGEVRHFSARTVNKVYGSGSALRNRRAASAMLRAAVPAAQERQRRGCGACGVVIGGGAGA